MILKFVIGYFLNNAKISDSKTWDLAFDVKLKGSLFLFNSKLIKSPLFILVRSAFLITSRDNLFDKDSEVIQF